MPTNNVLFWPNSHTRSKNFTVTDKPVRIIGNINPGDRVCVWRVYDGTSDECLTDKIPDIPVMCCDLCGHLSLWKEEYADCGSGYLTQTEILIESSGVYYLQYCCADPVLPIPTDCEFRTGRQWGGDGVDGVFEEFIFDSQFFAEFGSADPQSFTAENLDGNGVIHLGSEINYNPNGRPGEISVLFPTLTWFAFQKFTYTPTDDDRLRWQESGCETPAWEWFRNTPSDEVGTYDELPPEVLPCTETPDGVYVWYRHELIENCGCD